ncbi:MAG: kynureninase [Sulfobacillus sp.]
MSATDTEMWKRQARERDEADPLKDFRDDFYRPTTGIYLDGNSLGLISRRSESSLFEAVDAWRRLGVQGWEEGQPSWFYLAETLGQMLTPLVGGNAADLVLAGSTTVNLHQLVATFYKPQGARRLIVADPLNFPSDLYALKSQLALHGQDESALRLVSPGTDGLIREDDVLAALGPDVALVLLPSVVFRTGQLLDMGPITKAARAQGIPIGWDLSHSAGVVPHRLDELDPDFCVFCTYKYLSGGPGAPAALYLSPRHRHQRPALWGWFGGDKASQFDMSPAFTPALGAGAFQIGSPHVLSMAPLKGSLGLLAAAGIDRVRAKSLALTGFIIELTDALLASHGVSIGTPRQPQRRGGHVALHHVDAAQLVPALRAAGVVGDFRPPDIIRLCPSPLCTSFSDVLAAILQLRTALEGRIS